LSSQVSRLIRDEMRLAEKEFRESAKHAGIGAGLFSVAGLLAFFGAAALIAAAVAALSLVLAGLCAPPIVVARLLPSSGGGLSGRGWGEARSRRSPRRRRRPWKP